MKPKPSCLLPLILLIANFTFGQASSLPKVKLPSFKKDTFSIIKYGAVADGITLNTKSISSAIEACAKAGGGVVLIPGGMWLTGPLVMRSNVNLHLRKNAVLQFSADFNQYALVKGNWEGVPQMRNQSPISATGATNIAITGDGIIDGSGEAWRMVKKDKLTESAWKRLVASGGLLSADKKTWYPTEKSLKGAGLKNPGFVSLDKSPSDYDDIKDFLRPNLLVFDQCKQILLEGVTFQNSPAWCLHPLMSDDITIRNVNVKNPWYAQNGDGLDLESCKNVVIDNCVFDVGDDGICIKSGRDEEGRKRAMPTENVIIKNCTVYHAHGGFVIGSEMSGGAKKIYVNDCTFIGTDIGLRFKTTRGRGGIVEDIHVSNITMKDIPGEAILFDMYYAAQDPVPLAGEHRAPPRVEALPVNETTPQFRNIHINNVVCNGAEKAIFVRGLPEMNVQNIVLQDIVIQAKKGLDMTEGSDIILRNVRLITKDTGAVLTIHNSRNINLQKVTTQPEAAVFLNISGEKSDRITLEGSEKKHPATAIQYTYGATEKALQSKAN